MWYEVGYEADVYSGQTLAAQATLYSSWVTVPTLRASRNCRPELVEWIVEWAGVSSDLDAKLSLRCLATEMATGWTPTQANGVSALGQLHIKTWYPPEDQPGTNFAKVTEAIDQTNAVSAIPAAGKLSVYGCMSPGPVTTAYGLLLPLPSYLALSLEITTGFTAGSTADVHARFWAQNPTGANVI